MELSWLQVVGGLGCAWVWYQHTLNGMVDPADVTLTGIVPDVGYFSWLSRDSSRSLPDVLLCWRWVVVFKSGPRRGEGREGLSALDWARCM